MNTVHLIVGKDKRSNVIESDIFMSVAGLLDRGPHTYIFTPFFSLLPKL